MPVVWFGKENGSCTLVFHARPFISTAEITHFKYSAIPLISMIVANLMSCKWKERQELLVVCCDVEEESAEGKPVCPGLSPLLVRCVAVLYTWFCSLVSRAVSGVLPVCYWVSLTLCCPLFMVWDKAQLRTLCAMCFLTALYKECQQVSYRTLTSNWLRTMSSELQGFILLICSALQMRKYWCWTILRTQFK